MLAAVTVSAFIASLLLSYVLFPFAAGERLAEAPLARLVVTVVFTGTAYLIARSLRRPDVGHAEEGAPPHLPELPRDWSNALADHGFTSSQVQEILRRVYRDDRATCPAPSDVFRAFTSTQLDQVRVVIIGQDPYPHPGRADGYAFSVRRGHAIPHSLRRIFQNMEADPALNFSIPDHGSLDLWAKRGVLLLNTALTVRTGLPGTDHAEWKAFTTAVLAAVNDEVSPIIFFVWGDPANELVDQASLHARHHVIRSTHPRREEPSSYPRFQDTRPFSEANSVLDSAGRGPVDWSL